ncbi:unnamed protein product, partial [Prorocentrum cordatum]
DNKWNALSSFRDLADEVGALVIRLNVVFPSADFDAFRAQVAGACPAQDQRRRAEDARSNHRSVPLTPVPNA